MVGSHIAQRQWSYEQYVEELEASGVPMVWSGSQFRLASSGATLYDIWRMSVESISGEYPLTMTVLQLVSLLDGSSVDRRLLAELVCEVTAREASRSMLDGVDATVAELAQYSLIDLREQDLEVLALRRVESMNKRA